jgi:hypothetical protein
VGREKLAVWTRSTKCRVLRQVLRPECGIKLLPSVGRKAKRSKEPGFQPADGMCGRRQVPMKLDRLYYCAIGIGKEHW